VPFLFKSLANPTFSRLQYEAFLIVADLYKELTDVPYDRNIMKRKLQASFLLAALITTTSIISQPAAVAAGSSICNSVSCDNPQQSTVFGGIQDRPLDRTPAQSLGPICTVVNDWKTQVVIAIVGHVLKVSLVYTLTPIVICR
jgi:hypothetical protein